MAMSSAPSWAASLSEIGGAAARCLANHASDAGLHSLLVTLPPFRSVTQDV